MRLIDTSLSRKIDSCPGRDADRLSIQVRLNEEKNVNIINEIYFHIYVAEPAQEKALPMSYT
jgi:hypothetical protein